MNIFILASSFLSDRPYCINSEQVELGYNDFGLRNTVYFVIYFVVRINYSLITIILYSTVRRTLVYNDAKKFSSFNGVMTEFILRRTMRGLI
jgi:hypothetical protein